MNEHKVIHQLEDHTFWMCGDRIPENYDNDFAGERINCIKCIKGSEQETSTKHNDIIQSISEYSSGRFEVLLNVIKNGKPFNILLRLSKKEFTELANGLKEFLEVSNYE